MKTSFLQKVLGVFVFLAILAVAADAQRGRTASNPSRPKPIARDQSASILDLVNRERRRRDAGVLIWNEDLAAVARNYSRQMARENFFGHADRRGKSLRDRLDAARIDSWSGIGENLFFCEGYNDYAELSIRGWLGSSSHRKNMLNPSFSETGIGIAVTGDEKVYVTQIFLRR